MTQTPSETGGSTVDLVGLVHWLIDRVIWAWRWGLRIVRPYTVLVLLAAVVGALSFLSIVLTESDGALYLALQGLLLFVPGIILVLLWKRGSEAMAAGERLKGDISVLVQAPKVVDEAAALEKLKRSVEGKGKLAGGRAAAKGLSKLVWEHKGAIWNGKEAAELVRPPGPFTLIFGFLCGLIVLVLAPILLVAAVGLGVT
jgi:hypothetical protein